MRQSVRRCVHSSVNRPKTISLRVEYIRHNPPTHQTISNAVRKFEESESIIDIPRPVHQCNIRSTENVAAVAHSAEGDPNLSIPRRARQFGWSFGSLW